MEKKIFILVFIALLTSFFFPSLNRKGKNQGRSIDRDSKTVLKIEKKNLKANKSESLDMKVRENFKRRDKSVTSSLPDELALEDEDIFVEKALNNLEKIKLIPGARELVEEIVYDLERNSNLITYDNFEDVEMIDVDDHFLEKMIPNQEFREKFQKLMDLMAKETQKTLRSISEETNKHEAG